MTWVVVGAALVVAVSVAWSAASSRRRVSTHVDAFERARAAIAPDPWHRRRTVRTAARPARRVERPVVVRPRRRPASGSDADDPRPSPKTS